MHGRSKLVIVAVAFGLAICAHGVAATAANGTPYVLPDNRGNCPIASVPTLFSGGIVRCQLDPRSQADCPAKSTFRVIAGRGACSLNLDSPDYSPPLRTDVYSGVHACEHDSDCESAFCGGGFCAPDNAKH